MKDPMWKEAYMRQVPEMVERRGAFKLTRDVVVGWGGAMWWVSQANPH